MKKYSAYIAFQCFCLCCSAPCFAADEETDEQIKLPAQQFPRPAFEYQYEDRTDPFLPFVKEKDVNDVNMNDLMEPTEELYGMQLFEPDQLKVVGIIFDGKKNIAMVQDQVGQGYTLTEGILIGKRGVVKAITPQNVIVEETAITRIGQKKIRSIVMEFKPEGE